MKSTLAAGLALGLSSLFATGALACSAGDCLYAPASPAYAFAAPAGAAHYAPPADRQWSGWPPGYAAPPRGPGPGYAPYDLPPPADDGPRGPGYGPPGYEGPYGAQGYAAPPDYGPPADRLAYGDRNANPHYPCMSCAPPPVYAPRSCPKAHGPAPYVCLGPAPETVSLKGDFFTGGVGDTGGAYAGGGGWGFGGDNFVYSGSAGARLGAFVASRTQASAGAQVTVNASAYASARANSGGHYGGGCKGCGGGKRGGKH